MVPKKAPELFYDESRFCGGCGHGIFNRILAEVLEEMDIVSDTIICSDIGCNHQFQFWMNVDAIVPPHGKMGAAITAMKRVRPDKNIMTIAGDGGAYAIGIGETTSAALRNENVVMFVMNNTLFGMTGGQLAPTTMIDQKVASAPLGRTVEDNGQNTDVFKLMGDMDIAYLARTSVTSPANINKTKKAVRKAIEKHQAGKGFCLVEVLVPCPTNWHMTAPKSMEYIDEVVSKVYELGEKIDR